MPERMDSFGSKFMSWNASAQPDSHVPNPASPLMGRAPVNSPPEIPRMVFQKFKFWRRNHGYGGAIEEGSIGIRISPNARSERGGKVVAGFFSL